MKKSIKKEILKGPAERGLTDGEEPFCLTNAACATECTGLIQVPPETDEELKNYSEVYSFEKTELKDDEDRNDQLRFCFFVRKYSLKRENEKI